MIEQRPIPQNRNIQKDEVIELGSHWYKEKARYRRIEVWVEARQEIMVLVTNHLAFGSTTIAQIYKERWQIEIFFRYLKQNLRIKTFVGTSANALQIQIWTALIAMLLPKYLQLRPSFGWSLSNLTAPLRQQLFVYRDLYAWLDNPFQRRRRWKAGTTASWRWSSEGGYLDSRSWNVCVRGTTGLTKAAA